MTKYSKLLWLSFSKAFSEVFSKGYISDKNFKVILGKLERFK